MLAYYHHKGAWLRGNLELDTEKARIAFKADRPAAMAQDATIRTTGRIEEPCAHSSIHQVGNLRQMYQPPARTHLMLLQIGRHPRDRQAAFAVEDTKSGSVLSAFPHPGE
jgi:hypothetical protein